jgi:hypothetical protein
MSHSNNPLYVGIDRGEGAMHLAPGPSQPRGKRVGIAETLRLGRGTLLTGSAAT